MPLEKASRSPRVCSWRGRYRSWARIEPSTGKPLKAVFAARNRISAVPPATTKSRTEPDAEDGLAELGGDGLLHVAGRRADDLARRVLDELQAGQPGQRDDADEHGRPR